MNFGQILDAVCDDGIAANRRESAKEWVKARHAWIWGAANWTFKETTGAITFTANTQIASAPADVQATFAIYNSGGDPLRAYRDLRRFYTLYNTLGGVSASTPEAYTVVDGQIIIGPQGDGTTGMIVYQKQKPALVNDDDATGLPDGFDLALVHGGKAEGFKLTNAPALAAVFDADFEAAVNAMQNDWLENVLESGEVSGAFRPSAMWPAFGR
jgi:hypothetical protein